MNDNAVMTNFWTTATYIWNLLYELFFDLITRNFI